jgi:putative transposase
MSDSKPSPEHLGEYHWGYLPHIDAAGLTQHVTLHLADSLPAHVIEPMRQELAALPASEREVQRRTRIQDLLDAGLGCCLLRRPDCAQIVEDSLRFGDGSRYRLLCWVVMPNHLHVLIEQLPGWPLGKLVQSWKRHTTRQILRLPEAPSCPRNTPNAPPVWQHDYYDRFIRTPGHLEAARNYIEQNPVKAGLVARAEDWPWGSARFRR